MNKSSTVELATRRATTRLARILAPALRASDLVVLAGPLGSGKTFFVRALCRALGLPAAERVTSPTFTLVHEYETRLPVVHADLYRLKSAREVSLLGLDAMREEARLLLVEWGSDYQRELGGDALFLEFSIDPRRVALSATGARAAELLEAVRAALSARSLAP
jgi:tRNA threonylcarbamoyladenosine biosynthesis protein TsaE